jgi:hypothetical protein
MKRLFIIITLFIFLLTTEGYAQSPLFSIFESIEQQPKQGEGMVVIHQSDAIKRLIGTRIDSENIEVIDGKSHLKTEGYRIQVYSGNNQLVSRAEIDSLTNRIKVLYPDIETKRDFVSPWWKLYVGNYLTYQEAWLMCLDLQKTFPQRKKEINVIETVIRLPMDSQ